MPLPRTVSLLVKIVKVLVAMALPIEVLTGFLVLAPLLGFLAMILSAWGAGVAHRSPSGDPDSLTGTLITVGVGVAVGLALLLDALLFRSERKSMWRSGHGWLLPRLLTLAICLGPLALFLLWLHWKDLLWGFYDG